MANALTEEQRAQFAEAFAYFDSDGNGRISREELETVVRKVGAT